MTQMSLIPANQATEAQLKFLNSLRVERGYVAIDPEDWQGVTKRDASKYIDAMKAIKKPVAATEIETGMYVDNKSGQFIRVYKARYHDGKLAKALTEKPGGGWSFEYLGAAGRYIRDARRLTLEEAKAFGVEFGVCCVCAALLTDPESVAAGIGPVCGGRL